MCIRNAVAFATLLMAMVSMPASAHLMVAGHGTLNFVDDAAFMVVSLPVSAFAGLDENGDGEVTMIEFNRNRQGVQAAVENGIYLVGEESRLGLQGILLSPVLPHDGASDLVTDVVVMGRFTLGAAGGAVRFVNRLYGAGASPRTLTMTAAKPDDGSRSQFVLTPENPSRELTMSGTRRAAPATAVIAAREGRGQP